MAARIPQRARVRTGGRTFDRTTAPAYRGGGAFSVTDLPSLKLWLDASDSDTRTEYSGKVGQWDDKSGEDNHATMGDDANRPLVVSAEQNGLDVLRFDGSTDHMFHPVIAASPWQLSVFFVFKHRENSNGVLWGHRDHFTRLIQLGFDAGNDFHMTLRSNTSSLIKIAGTKTQDAWMHGLLQLDATNSVHNLWINGTAQTASTEDFSGEDFTVTNNVISGAEVLGVSYQPLVDIAEIVIADGVWTDAEKSSLFAYADSKWGL